MSYLGVRRTRGNHNIIVKVHGPLDKFSLDTKELKDSTDAIILNYMDKPLSDLPRVIANTLCEVFANGDDIVWVEVDLITKSDVFYGASAEKVGV